MILGILILQTLILNQSPPEVSFGPGEHPVLSPDGKTIAFERSGRIWTLDIASKKSLSLTPYSKSFMAAWSPDARHLIFQSIGFDSLKGNYFSIWRIDSDGSNLKRLSSTNATMNAGDQFPRWSPDGEHIVWTHGSQIWIMDSDGRNPRPLATRSESRYEYACDFSPDGKLLAYLASDDMSSTYRIRILSIADGIQKTLSKGIVALGVRWSEDGRYLYYNTGAEIKRIRADVTEEPQSVYRFKEGLEISNFDLSRDNRFIVYDDNGPERDGTIYIGMLQ